MLTPLHRTLGLEPGRLSWEVIEDAIEGKVEESNDLDWKQALYDVRNPKWQDECAKDIAAMANSGGGWIVFGVAEDPETSRATEITGVEWAHDHHQRLLRVAYGRVGPPVLGLEFHVVSEDTGEHARQVVAMRVPDSSDRPHLARVGDTAFSAPVRNGPHTAFMTDRELERAFRDRFNSRIEREELLQSLYDEVAERLDPRQGVCFAFVAAPNEPRAAPVGARGADLEAVFRQTQPGLFYAPDQPTGSPWSSDPGRIRRGRRQWTRRSQRAWKAVHEDGTVQAALRLGGLTSDDRAAPRYPVGKVNHCMSKHVEQALTESIALLRKWATTLGAAGGYRFRAGLVGQSGDAIYIRSTIYGIDLLADVADSEPIPRFHAITVDLDPLDSVDDLLPALREAALDLINQGGVESLDIIAESVDKPR